MRLKRPVAVSLGIRVPLAPDSAAGQVTAVCLMTRDIPSAAGVDRVCVWGNDAFSVVPGERVWQKSCHIHYRLSTNGSPKESDINRGFSL